MDGTTLAWMGFTAAGVLFSKGVSAGLDLTKRKHLRGVSRRRIALGMAVGGALLYYLVRKWQLERRDAKSEQASASAGDASRSALLREVSDSARRRRGLSVLHHAALGGVAHGLD